MQPPCKLVDWPMYWDTWWFTRYPGANTSDTQRQTLSTGPIEPASGSGFYATLLENRVICFFSKECFALPLHIYSHAKT